MEPFELDENVFDDIAGPNCPKCLERMDPRVGAWWCADCAVALRPD